MGPPAFLTATGHPLRWRLLGELARGDLAVRELTARLGQPQNLVSYHLGKLRRADLVTARRSSADGRDTYYSLDVTRCAELLSTAGGSLHPALRLDPPAPPVPSTASVLFVCTGNSARSPMAEALLRHRTGGAVTAAAAGTDPRPLHPHAITVMAEYGIDIRGARPRHVDEFAGRHFTEVVTVCDRAREACPAGTIHWSVAPPDGLPAFRSLAAELDRRIGFLLHTLAKETS